MAAPAPSRRGLKVTLAAALSQQPGRPPAHSPGDPTRLRGEPIRDRHACGGWRCGVRNSKRRGVLEEPGSRAVGAGPPPARLPERPHPPSAYRGETGGLPGARRALCPPPRPRDVRGQPRGGDLGETRTPAPSRLPSRTPSPSPTLTWGRGPGSSRPEPGRAGPHRRAAAAGAGAAVPDSPPARSAAGPLRPPRPGTARPPGLGQQRRGGPAAGPGAAGPLPGPRRCAPSWPCPDTAVPGCAAPLHHGVDGIFGASSPQGRSEPLYAPRDTLGMGSVLGLRWAGYPAAGGVGCGLAVPIANGWWGTGVPMASRGIPVACRLEGGQGDPHGYRGAGQCGGGRTPGCLLGAGGCTQPDPALPHGRNPPCLPGARQLLWFRQSLVG